MRAQNGLYIMRTPTPPTAVEKFPWIPAPAYWWCVRAAPHFQVVLSGRTKVYYFEMMRVRLGRIEGG